MEIHAIDLITRKAGYSDKNEKQLIGARLIDDETLEVKDCEIKSVLDNIGKIWSMRYYPIENLVDVFATIVKDGSNEIVTCNRFSILGIYQDGSFRVCNYTGIIKYGTVGYQYDINSCNWHASTLIFPDSVRLISSWALSNTMFSNIVLNEGLEIVCEYALSFCKNIESIVIPSTVKLIEYNAFFNCRSLERIVLKSRDTRICSDIESMCTYLE